MQAAGRAAPGSLLSMDSTEQEFKLSPGQILSNRYEIVSFLGRGGMASVYLASDTLLNGTRVALKVLHLHLQHQSAQYQRFLREVQLTRLVTHPNVVRTYDVGQDRELTYYTMEIISGVSLDRIIDEAGQLPVDRALRYILQVCAGLCAIHRCEIIHRDLKPANILVVEQDQIKITDFGVARPKISHLTEDNSFCGTVLYIAPEVFRGEDITPATDCYGLGVMLYEMLTGDVPFRDEIIGKLIGMHLSKPPLPPISARPDIPPWLNELTLAMLAKRPIERPSLEEIMYIVGSRLEGAAATQPKFSGSRSLLGGGMGTDDLKAPTDPRSLLERTAPQLLRSVRNTVAYPYTKRPALRLSHLVVLVILSLSAGLAHFALYQSALGQRLEQAVLDVWFPIRGAIPPPDDVVLIAMDEQSYSNLNVAMTEAWPRRLHAELLRRLSEFGAKRVVFDILFMNAGEDAAVDQELAAAIGAVPTVLGSSFMATQRATMNGSFLFEEYIEPYDAFAQRAAAIGVVGLPNDYGRIRRFNTEQSERYKKLMALATAGAGAYEKPIELPGRYDLINYYGPARTIETVSYEMVLEPEEPLPPDLFRGKVALVGLLLNSSTGPMQREAFPSPFHGLYLFGAEIHATAIGNILHNNWIRRAHPRKEAVVLSALAFLLALAVLSAPTAYGRLICLGAFLFWATLAYAAFTYGFYVPGVLLVGVVLPLTFTIVVLQRQISSPVRAAYQ